MNQSHHTKYGANEMDFLAASVALMERQQRNINTETVTGNMTAKQLAQFKQRLDFYRKEYGNQEQEQQETVE